MYTASDEEANVAALNERLEADQRGEHLADLLQELSGAEEQIEGALKRETGAAERQLLTELTEAVKSSEEVLTEVWKSMHGGHSSRGGKRY